MTPLSNDTELEQLGLTYAQIQLIKQREERIVREADRRTLETLSSILSGSGKNVFGDQHQTEKRTIEIAQSYINNKLNMLQRMYGEGKE